MSEFDIVKIHVFRVVVNNYLNQNVSSYSITIIFNLLKGVISKLELKIYIKIQNFVINIYSLIVFILTFMQILINLVFLILKIEFRIYSFLNTI